MAFPPRAMTFLAGLLAATQAGCGAGPARFASPGAAASQGATASPAPAALMAAVRSPGDGPPAAHGQDVPHSGPLQKVPAAGLRDPAAQGGDPAPGGAIGGGPVSLPLPGPAEPDPAVWRPVPGAPPGKTWADLEPDGEPLDHPGFRLASLAGEIAALEAEAQREPAAERYRPPRVSEGNRLSLHPDADGYAALRDLILSASRSIVIETFGFSSDPVAMGLAELLARRRAEGLAVRVLVDGYRVKADEPVLKYLAERGVAVRRYNPKLVYKLGINITHRKIYAADGTRAMTGGMNLVKRYECCVHDYLVTVRGPAARDLVAEFESDWNASGPAERVLDPADGNSPIFEDPVLPGQGRATVVVTSRREADRAQEIRRAISALVTEARNEIVFAYPYFSDDTFVSQLGAAVSRGVRVRAILPEETDEAVMRVLNPRNARQLWKAGGEIRIYDARFSHAKYLFVDGKKALLGSNNADTLTFKYNQEASLLIEDPAFVAEAQARLAETDWAASRPPRYQDLHLPWYLVPKGALFELFDFVL